MNFINQSFNYNSVIYLLYQIKIDSYLVKDFDKFYETNKHLEHELVVISTPKTIIGEWRVICSKDSIIDYSLYRYQGQISKIRVAPPNVLEFATKMLKVGYFPDDVFCFDICTDSDNNCWLLELTSFSSCGLYASDKNKLVKEISKIAFEDYERRIK